MGNKHSSSVAPQEKRRVNIVQASPRDDPAPVSHITLKCHRSQASLMKSSSSHETFRSEKHPYPYHYPVDPLPVPLPTPPPSSAYTPLAPPRSQQHDAARAYTTFLKTFPEYQSTWIIDSLRRTDFGRLDRAGETYVDYMGGAQHPESLVCVHGAFLTQNVLGNTHSVSNR